MHFLNESHLGHILAHIIISGSIIMGCTGNQTQGFMHQIFSIETYPQSSVCFKADQYLSIQPQSFSAPLQIPQHSEFMNTTAL